MRPLLLLVLLLAACRPAAVQGNHAPGSVRFNLSADPANLNPLFTHPDAASVELQMARLLFEPFIDLDPAGHGVPALLATIPTTENGGISADGRTLTFRLRPGVRWSDGVAVSSRDVLFTLHAILDPRNPVRSREGYDLIDRATAPTPLTVVLHLKRRWAPAATTFFSYGSEAQFVLPAHVLAKYASLAQASFNGAPAVGDGPYRFEAWSRGDRIAYVANPAYWRGAPQVARLDVHIVPDPATNLAELGSGELDWNLVAPVQQYGLRGQRGLAYRYVSTATIAGIAVNLRHTPLGDVRVRRAIAMSIDRNAISAKITFGRYPVADSAQPRFSWAYDPAVREPAYDPARADTLLDAAGWRRDAGGWRKRGNVPLALTYVQFPESTTGVRAATMIQAWLRARGIDLTVKSISNAQLFQPRIGTLARGDFDLAYIPWTFGADPDDSALLTCAGAENVMGYCNRDVDRLEAAALDSTSRAPRKALYARIARTIANELPIVYLFNATYIYAYRPQLHGFSPNAFLPTWNAGSWSLMSP